jgi:hypothetical protein
MALIVDYRLNFLVVILYLKLSATRPIASGRRAETQITWEDWKFTQANVRGLWSYS